MNMSRNVFRYSSRQKIPDDNASIVAANRQEGSILVEAASYSQ
jgi:hypothetical protein